MGSVTARPSQPIVTPPRGGTVTGPGGGMMVGHQRPGGGGSAAIAGPRGDGIGGIRGPNGGAAGGIRGPGGGSIARAQGPRGGVGGVVRGPGGGAVGGVRGPNGGAIVGGRGPWGGSGAIAQLPSGTRAVNWNGSNYWRSGNHWYSPYWRDGGLWYWPTYPPVGWWMAAADWDDDENITTVVIENKTYYESEGVYYEKTTKGGQEGYAVVEEPQQAVIKPDPNLPDPFEALKKGLTYMGQLPQFTMAVSDSYDEVTEAGQKVSNTTRREINCRRPGNFSIEFTSDEDSRRSIFDGKNITMIDRKKNAYGQAPMPATIDEALDKLADDFGVTVVAAELLRANLYDHLAPNIQTGQYLGRDAVIVYECDHLGFTTPDKDLEVWFQIGDKPVLRKVSISYKNVPARPRYTMLIPRLDVGDVPDMQFNAQIPTGAMKVNLTPLPKAPAAPDPSISRGF
jgi:hypothetical protein